MKMAIDTASCRRTRPRAAIARPSTLRAADAKPLDVTVEDLSPTGFCFSSSTPIPTGTPVRVGLAGAGRTDAEVAWREGERHGCTFTTALTPAQSEAAFSHAPGEPATVTLMRHAGTPARPAPNLHSGRQVALPARFALTALAGGLGWAMLALAMRGLQLST